MGLIKWIFILIIAVVAFAYFMPDTYHQTIGVHIDSIISPFANLNPLAKANVTNSTTDFGLPITNATNSTTEFMQCTTSNICIRDYGEDAYCNMTDGHCYK